MALIDPAETNNRPEPLPLRILDEERQALLDQLVPALDGALIDLATGEQFATKARVVAPLEVAAGAWLIGPVSQPALRLMQWDGAPVILHAERIADIATALTRADPLLSALELRLGTPFEPDQMAAQAPQGCAVLALDFYDNGGLRHQLLLAFARNFQLPIDPATNDLNMTRASVVASVECTVASLDVDDASTIGAGDLLILRGGSWVASLVTPFGGIAGQYDPMTNQFSVGNGDPNQGQDKMSDDVEGSGDGGFGSLKVPVSIKLPDQGLTIEELGRLRAGLAVPVGPVAAGLEVALTVAGRTIAIGELVRLGDQFAVHIDRIPQDAGPPPVVSQGMAMPDHSGDAGDADEFYPQDSE